MALLLDASSPARVSGTANPATSAAFSPPANTLLIALVSADSSNTFSLAGGGLSWSPIGSRNDGSTCAVAAFWAWNPNAQTNITVSSTRTGSFTAHQLRVLVFTGAESTFGGATSNAAALTTSLTTTQANSWVWAIGASENGDTAASAAANCTVNDSYAAFGGVSGGVIKQTSPSLASGASFTIGVSGVTLPSILAVEVREPGDPSASPQTVPGTLPTFVAAATPTGAGTTTTAGVAAQTPARPTGTAAGDRVFVVQAASNTSATTPSGWTAIAKDVQVGPTGTAPGAGTGRRYLSVSYRDYDGVWAMPTWNLTSATQNSHQASAITLRKAAGEAWAAPTWSGVGNTASASTAWNVTTPSMATTDDAMLISASATNDNVTASGQTISQSGATFANVTERADAGTATGNDVSLKAGTAEVTTGGTGGITRTGTLSAASEGGTGFVQQTTTKTILVYTKVGTGNAAAAAAGTETVTPAAGTTYTKAGTGAAVAVAAGPKTRTTAATYTKAGAGAAAAAAAGAKVRTTAATWTKTGLAAAAGAATGVKVVHRVKTGVAAAPAAAAGAKTVTSAQVITKAGTGATAAAAAGVQARTTAAAYAKTGACAAAGAANGTKTVTSAGQQAKTGAAAAAGAASGVKSVHQVKTGTGAAPVAAAGGKLVTSAGQQIKTGGAAASAAASGVQVRTSAAAYVKTGVAAAAGAATGGKVRTSAAVYVKTGAGAAAAVAAGAQVRVAAGVYAKTGAAAVAAAGAGVRLITTGWRYPGSASSLSGPWVNLPGAVGPTEGDTATWTATGAGTAVLELAGFGLDQVVPDGATVQDLTLRVRTSVSDPALVGTLSAQCYVGATPIGSAQPLVRDPTTHDDLITVSGVAYADLPDLRVRISTTRGG